MEADDLDRAADLTRAMAEARVEAARWASRPEQVRNADGTWPEPDCVDCGNEMVPERLAFGRIRCVHCQGLRERRLKGI